MEGKYTFESLLVDISTTLVNLPLETIDSAIESSMKMLVEFFEADRCHLGEFADDHSKIEVSHFYSKPGVNIPQVTDVSKQYLSFVYENIKKDQVIALASTTEIPDSAKIDRAVIDNLGIKSVLVIPLKIDNNVVYALSLANVGKHRRWEEATINQIKIGANILANVMQRKRALEQLKEEKEWAEAVLEGMPQLAYVLDLQGRLKRWNKNTVDILGYTPEELKDKFIGDFYNDEVHLQRVMKTVEKVIADGRERSVEYDFITKSGEIVPYYYGSGKLVEVGGVKYIVGQTIDISEMKQAQKKIALQLEEIKVLKDQLEAENIYLRKELTDTGSFREIVGESDVLKHILYRVEQVAPMDTTVLLEGETGTGKELFARAIHEKSKRRKKPMIVVNCASLPPTLIESELFGHEKGAFTGALQRQIGRFELADGGTIFLDEIGEIPLELQAKLLRVLQEGEFERIGNPKTIKIDVRVISATNRDLEKEILEDRFRNDLYYRLSVYPISIAPLRQRTEDIPPLVTYIVNRLNKKLGKNITRISNGVLKRLMAYDWPGNIRELENIIERAMILSKSSTLAVEKLNPANKTSTERLKSLADHERDYIQKVLEQTLWRINGPKGAATILDMHPETLRSRIKKFGLKRPDPSE